MGVIGTSTTRVLPFRGDGRSGLLPARCESPRRPRHLVRRAAADGTGAGSGESAGASVRRAGASVRQTSASVRRPVQRPAERDANPVTQITPKGPPWPAPRARRAPAPSSRSATLDPHRLGVGLLLAACAGRQCVLALRAGAAAKGRRKAASARWWWKKGQKRTACLRTDEPSTSTNGRNIGVDTGADASLHALEACAGEERGGVEARRGGARHARSDYMPTEALRCASPCRDREPLSRGKRPRPLSSSAPPLSASPYGPSDGAARLPVLMPRRGLKRSARDRSPSLSSCRASGVLAWLPTLRRACSLVRRYSPATFGSSDCARGCRSWSEQPVSHNLPCGLSTRPTT
eukprot:364920-Chlamydomonas_euryale.AAC.1